MDQHALGLEGLKEDHGVCSCTFTDSLDLEHLVCEQRALLQLPPALLTNRQRSVLFLFSHAQAK